METIREGVNVDKFRRSTVLLGPDHIDIRHKQIELQLLKLTIDRIASAKLVDLAADQAFVLVSILKRCQGAIPFRLRFVNLFQYDSPAAVVHAS